MVFRWHIGLRLLVTPVACSARHLRLAIVDHAHIVVVNLLCHGVHQPRRILLGLRVVCEIQPRPAVRPHPARIGRVASVAVHAQRPRPAFHDVAHLLAGKVLGKHFQIGGGREFSGPGAGSAWRGTALRSLGCAYCGRWLRRLCGHRYGHKSRSQQGNRGSSERRRRSFQAERTSAGELYGVSVS